MKDAARSRWFARGSAVALGVALGAFVACKSDDDGPSAAPGDPNDCRLIASWCHSYDAETEIARECHDVGHEGASPERCTELKASCREACPPRPDSGTAGSSGSGGGTSSGGSGGTGSGGGTDTGGTSGTGAAGQPADGGAGGSGAVTTGGSGGAGATSGQGGTSSGGGGTGPSAGTAGTGPDAGETACELLGRVCHGIGPGFTEECHELGHDGDEPACQAELAECLAACQDGGV